MMSGKVAHSKVVASRDGKLLANGTVSFASLCDMVASSTTVLGLGHPVERSVAENDNISCRIRVGAKLGEGSAGVVWKVRGCFVCRHVTPVGRDREHCSCR